MSTNHTLFCPKQIVIGGDCSKTLPNHIKSLKANKALVVTEAYLEQVGVAQQFASMFEQEGLHSTIFSGVQADPTTKNVVDGLEVLKDFGADVVVALGGGSSIDAAKVISCLTANHEPIATYKGHQNIPNPGVPLIAIPTTAGTGSEVTQGAVITDTESDVKMLFMDSKLLPAIALVDFSLSMTMPKPLTAHVGVDTLTHGIEALVSKKSHPTTDAFALSCIKLVAEHLVTAWEEPDNLVAREGMALAACHGGLAFSNSSVALIHGMSRPIGALFHVPHGLSNAALLPTVLDFSAEAAPEKFALIARTMQFASEGDSLSVAIEKLQRGINDLNTRLEVPKLRDCIKQPVDVFANSVTKMARDALASGSPQNNPIVPSEQQIIELYHQAW